MYYAHTQHRGGIIPSRKKKEDKNGHVRFHLRIVTRHAHSFTLRAMIVLRRPRHGKDRTNAWVVYRDLKHIQSTSGLRKRHDPAPPEGTL